MKYLNKHLAVLLARNNRPNIRGCSVKVFFLMPDGLLTFLLGLIMAFPCGHSCSEACAIYGAKPPGRTHEPEKCYL